MSLQPRALTLFCHLPYNSICINTPASCRVCGKQYKHHPCPPVSPVSPPPIPHMPVFCVVAALALRRDQQRDSDNDAVRDFGLNSTPRYSSACDHDPDRPGMLDKGSRGTEDCGTGVVGVDGVLPSSSSGVPLLQGGAAPGGAAQGELAESTRDEDQPEGWNDPFSV